MATRDLKHIMIMIAPLGSGQQQRELCTINVLEFGLGAKSLTPQPTSTWFRIRNRVRSVAIHRTKNMPPNFSVLPSTTLMDVDDIHYRKPETQETEAGAVRHEE